MNSPIRKLMLAAAVSFAMFGATASAGTLSQEVTDARHEAQIWTTYALSPHLQANDIDVKVVSGTATLSGVVEDDVDKELAREIALGVSGIAKVDNRIEVQPEFTSAAESGRTFADVVDDASITAAVKSKLLWSRHADGLSTTVSTMEGAVSLAGTANSAEAKELAGRLASNTRGVRAVDNQLKVVDSGPSVGAQVEAKANDAGAAISDSWITTRVKSTYMYSSNVSGKDISVSTDHGVVTLTGKVASGAERALAVELAENIRGVRSVQAQALTL